MKYLLILAGTILMLVACDVSDQQSQSSRFVAAEGAALTEGGNNKRFALPTYKALDGAIVINWRSVQGAVEYELFWQNETGKNSAVTELTNFQLFTSGYETYQVWLVAVDAQGNVVSQTDKLQVSSLNPDATVIFSDMAPTK